MRQLTAGLLFLAAIGVGVLLPAAGYCELWLRKSVSLGVELGACGTEPNLDDAYWVTIHSVFPLAAVLLLCSLVVLRWGSPGRARSRARE